MPALLLSLLGNIIPDVVKRVLPAEKISEEDRAKLANEMTLAFMQADWQSVEAEYKDRADARNLAAQDIAKGNALTAFLSAVVRPVWGLGAFVMVGYSILYSVPIDPATREIIQTVLWFYFGGRTIEKVVPHIAEAIKR